MADWDAQGSVTAKPHLPEPGSSDARVLEALVLKLHLDFLAGTAVQESPAVLCNQS